MDSNNNVSIKTRVYEWIEYLCTHHKLGVPDIPVMFTRECVSTKFSISVRQTTRVLESLVEEKKIYRNKLYNNIYIYSLKPIKLDRDILVRVRP